MTATAEQTRVHQLREEARFLDRKLGGQSMAGLQPMAGAAAARYAGYPEAMSEKCRTIVRRQEIEVQLQEAEAEQHRAELREIEQRLADDGDELQARVVRTEQRVAELAAELEGARLEAIDARDQWQRLIGRRGVLLQRVTAAEGRIAAARREQERQRQLDPMAAQAS
jgi:hypothetical protein